VSEGTIETLDCYKFSAGPGRGLIIDAPPPPPLCPPIPVVIRWAKLKQRRVS